MKPEEMRRLYVRNRAGSMVPLATVANVEDRGGPFVIDRYNMHPAAAVNGELGAWHELGEVIATVQRLAERPCPPSMAFEWTELMSLQLIAGNTTIFVFGGAVVLVFLVLAGQ